MFAAVLKQVTGYFDRRALLSAFFPTLALLGAVTLAAAAFGRSSTRSSKATGPTASPPRGLPHGR
jgi:hypothetical protein